MEEEGKEPKPSSSLPSNYVTLAQLQERWLLKQQTEKARQQLEEELELERKKAEIDRKNRAEDVKNRRQNELAVRPRNGRRHRRHLKAKESQIESATVDGGSKTADESKEMSKEKHGRNEKKRREPRIQELGSGGAVEVEPEGKVVEIKVTEATSKINRNCGGCDQSKNRWVWEAKTSSSRPLLQSFQGLSGNGGKEAHVSSQERSNSHNRRVFRRSESFQGLPVNGGWKEGHVTSKERSNGHNGRGSIWSESRARRDGNLVWMRKGEVVKKGEVTDAANVNAVQC